MSSIMQRSCSKGSSERELKFMLSLYKTANSHASTNPHAPNNVTVNIY